MKPRHRIQRLLMPIIRNQPPRRLRQKRRAHQHRTRKHHLQPQWNAPRLRPIKLLRPKRHKTPRNTADVPERVEHARTHAPIRGVRHFAHVCRPRGRCDGDAEAEDEAPAHEAAEIGARGLDAGADHDDAAADEHAPFPAAEVCGWARDEGANEIADGVDGVDDAGFGRAGVEVEVEVFAVLFVVVDGAHEGAVVAVYA